MPSNTPPSKNISPLSVIHESRDMDDCPSTTDLTSKFNIKTSVNNDSNNNMNNNNNPSSGKNGNNNSNSNNNNGTAQQFCLRWNNYQTNLTCVFDQLLQSESFVDVTLACDGNQIKAHKIVLSACSPYFQSLFFDNPCQHPIIIMRDVKWPELKAIVEFMYKGEINVNQDQISPLLAIAEMLQIRGLAEVNNEQGNGGANSGNTDLAETQIKSKQIPSVDLTSKSRSTESSPAPTFDMDDQINQQTQNFHNNQDKSSDAKRARITPRDWESMASLDALNPSQSSSSSTSSSSKNHRKRRWPSGERNNLVNSPENLENSSPISHQAISHPSPTSSQIPPFTLPTPLDTIALQQLSMHHPDDLEIKPGIAEMIREEERAKLLENSAWLGASPSNMAAESYQYQLQSMWQKCWNSQNLVQHMRFRERGPLKSWRPETMAEAIFSVLKEGLSLSQAARKYDIPYPTFVLYANRVHNMLGPSMDGGTDLRPKGRGRPQRILLGIWPDEHIKGVIKSVVFRDEKILKEDPMVGYGRQSPFPFQDASMTYPNGLNPAASAETMSPDLLAAVRQQMCNMVDAANFVAGFNLPSSMSIQSMAQPNLSGGGSNNNVSNQKIVSPSMNSLAKNGGEPSNILQMPRLGSPAMHSLPNELSMKGLRKEIDEDDDDHHKSLNNRLSITKLSSPKNLNKISPIADLLEPAVNLAVTGQSLDMSYKSSRNSSEGSINGEDRMYRNSSSGFKDSSPIKLEPMTECRD